MPLVIAANRHPSVQHFEFLFEYDHLPAGEVRDRSAACATLAQEMVNTLGDGPELTAGLRELLKAKDCFVRQQILDNRAATAAAANAGGNAGTDRQQF